MGNYPKHLGQLNLMKQKGKTSNYPMNVAYIGVGGCVDVAGRLIWGNKPFPPLLLNSYITPNLWGGYPSSPVPEQNLDEY
jgi:hypothetical protein